MSSDRLALHLYRTHRDTLIHYAGRLSGDLVAAEDIVQDAWILLSRQTDPGKIRKPLGYMRRIVRNLVFAQARSNREICASPDTMPEIPDTRPSVEHEIMDRQSMALVLQAIAGMPDRQQTAIKLYHFEGMKLREVAEQINLSVSYTHSLIADGMEICNRCRQRGAMKFSAYPDQDSQRFR